MSIKDVPGTGSAGSGGSRLGSSRPEDLIRRRSEDVGLEARTALEGVKTATVEQSETAKERAAGSLSDTAGALEKAASETRPHSTQHRLLTEAAHGLTQISRSVEGRSVGEIVESLSDFGRRNPLAFLGGAALTGFALSRFARASEQPRPSAARSHSDPAPDTQPPPAPRPSKAPPGPAPTPDTQPEPAPRPSKAPPGPAPTPNTRPVQAPAPSKAPPGPAPTSSTAPSARGY